MIKRRLGVTAQVIEALRQRGAAGEGTKPWIERPPPREAADHFTKEDKLTEEEARDRWANRKRLRMTRQAVSALGKLDSTTTTVGVIQSLLTGDTAAARIFEEYGLRTNGLAD